MYIVFLKCREDTGLLLFLVCIAYLEEFHKFISFNISFVDDALRHVKVKIICFLFLFRRSVVSPTSPELLWSSISPQAIIY